MKTKVLLIAVLFGNLMLQSVQAEDVLTRKKVFQDWVNLEDSYMKSTKFAVATNRFTIIDRKTVTGDATSLNYSTHRLASGTYIVSVETEGKQLSTEKIIIK